MIEYPVKAALSHAFHLEQNRAKKIEEDHKDKFKRIGSGIGKALLIGGGVAATAAGITLGFLLAPKFLLLFPIGAMLVLGGSLWTATGRFASRPQYPRLEQLEKYKKMALEDEKFQEFVQANPVTFNKNEMWRLDAYLELYELQQKYPAIVAESKKPGVDRVVVNPHQALEEINQRRIQLGLPKYG